MVLKRIWFPTFGSRYTVESQCSLRTGTEGGTVRKRVIGCTLFFLPSHFSTSSVLTTRPRTLLLRIVIKMDLTRIDLGVGGGCR